MATITTALTRTGGAELFEKAESARELVADTIEPTDPPIRDSLTHCFIGIQQFDVSGDPVLAGAGTYAVSVKTVNSEVFEAVAGSPIDATAPVTLNFAANVSNLRVVPTGITTAVTYKVVLIGNGR